MVGKTYRNAESIYCTPETEHGVSIILKTIAKKARIQQASHKIKMKDKNKEAMRSIYVNVRPLKESS